MAEDWQDQVRALFEALASSTVFWVGAGVVLLLLVGAYSGGKKR